MPDTIISQFDRAFNEPIETNRQVNFISDRDAIPTNRRWEGMKVYVISEGKDYQLIGGIDNLNWSASSEFVDSEYTKNGGYEGTAQDIVDLIDQNTGEITKVIVTNVGNLNYHVIADPGEVNGEYYYATPTTVTLNNGDATHPRIDVIYLDTDGLIGVVEGTPAASPSKPTLLYTQSELTFITVPATATTDPTVTNELAYDEDLGTAGGEFDITGINIGAIDTSSTAVAFSGTKSIYYSGSGSFIAYFRNDVAFDVSDVTNFYFRIYVTEVQTTKHGMYFRLEDASNVGNGRYILVKDGKYGFNRNTLNEWQVISIPIEDFRLTTSSIKGFSMLPYNSARLKCYIDTINFQFNDAQPPAPVNPIRLTELLDTPSTYSGQGGKAVTVKIDETGVEFSTPAGGGDMLASVYDPTNVNDDAFDMDNMVEGTTNKILTAAERTILSNTSGTNTGDQDLSGLQPKPAEGQFVDGDKTKLDSIESGAEVNNISDVNATDLTDGGDSTLHYHSSDRNRTNHTGTQTASTISDFDTEVSNNTNVLANTNKLAEPNADIITTTVSITQATLTDSGDTQEGKVIGISNGVNAINYTVNGAITASYVLLGTGAVTFVQGAGRTLVQANATAILNGAVGSTASIVSYGTTDYLYINNI